MNFRKCPICRLHEFTEDFERCPFCEWQHDRVQEKDPTYWGGANNLCINDYKAEWLNKKYVLKDLTPQMLADYKRYLKPECWDEFKQSMLEENSVAGQIINILDIYSADGKELLERRYQRKYEIGTDTGLSLLCVNAGLKNLNELLEPVDPMKLPNLCPCCGLYEHDTPPGSNGICVICKWQDDIVQRDDPYYENGANGMSLNEAREIFTQCRDIRGNPIANICPCCGLYEHNRIVGNYYKCPLCCWKDDENQRQDPNLSSGSNQMSLNQAKIMFKNGITES